MKVIIKSTTRLNRLELARRRQIGAMGTLARVLLGLVFGSFGVLNGQVIVINGQFRSHFEIPSFIFGVVAFPALLLGLQWLRVRLAPAPLQATGPVGTVLNILIFTALASTPLFAPQLTFIGYATFVFVWRLHVDSGSSGLRRMRGTCHLQLDPR